ncbi:ecdysteroid-regulated 16 kDa protein-like [Anopheles marshallii]|uniref:ecdysteroid-regulated 16 kDa protein-like n=1 Tax=Anopheles marshallii TaxID=1521116 RepID=UPI00237AE10B|nr:ecdysteroid-regulated 16 kDa protein-like [Anopheles marshallii]
MKCLQTVVSVVLLALCLHVVSAEVVNFQKCPGEATEKCTIHEVSITPCPEAEKGNVCTLLTRSQVNITFDFTPEFAAHNLTADVSWTRPNLDLPFVGMDKEACERTNCPVVAGNRQRYTYNLTIKKEYPPQYYDVKWKLTSDNNDSCCFIVPITIAKKKKAT